MFFTTVGYMSSQWKSSFKLNRHRFEVTVTPTSKLKDIVNFYWCCSLQDVELLRMAHPFTVLSLLLREVPWWPSWLNEYKLLNIQWVCVCVRERESVCVSVWERESVWVCVYVWERESVWVCVCVYVWERKCVSASLGYTVDEFCWV